MWYLAEILFADPREDGRRVFFCESCDVLFQAPTAEAAFLKAMDWGRSHSGESIAAMELLGVAHLTLIGEQLGDGVEICGRFFRKRDVWDRVDRLIPPTERLKSVVWERDKDTPIGELLGKTGVQLAKRVFGVSPSQRKNATER